MLSAEVIEPAQSDWASPIAIVPKNYGTPRLCVDYRKLNRVTIPYSYQIPRMDDYIDGLGDSTMYSALDDNWGYWQMPISEEDRDKKTFVTHRATFRWLRMPFGLSNAPATFQRSLDLILFGVRFKTCPIYLDDLLIFSRKLEDCIKHVDEVLTVLENAGVSLKIRKCQLFRKSVDYLGHVLLSGRIAIVKDSTSAIDDANLPLDIAHRPSFLGTCNVYHRFIRGFRQMAETLNLWLRKDVKPTWSDPPKEQFHAFQALKQTLLEPPVLALPVSNKNFLLDTDSSPFQIGVTLLQ